MDLETSKAVDCRVLKKLPFQIMPHYSVAFFENHQEECISTYNNHVADQKKQDRCNLV